MYGNQYADTPGRRKDSPFLPMMKSSDYTLSDYARRHASGCFMPGSDERMRNKQESDSDSSDGGGWKPNRLPDGFALPKPGEKKKYLPNPMDYSVPPGIKFDSRGMPILRNPAEIALRDRLRGFTDIPEDGSPPAFFDSNGTAIPSPGSLTPDGDRPSFARRVPLAMLEHPCVPQHHEEPNTAVYRTTINEDPIKHGKMYWAKQQLKKMVGIAPKPSKYGPNNPPANLVDHICPPDSPHCHVIEGSKEYWTADAKREFELRTGRTVPRVQLAWMRSRVRTHDRIVDAKDKGRRAMFKVTKPCWSKMGTARRATQKAKLRVKRRYKATPPKVLIQRLPVSLRVGVNAWKTEWKNGAKEREYLSHTRTANYQLRRLRVLQSPTKFAWDVFRERMTRRKISKNGDKKCTGCNRDMPKKSGRRARKDTTEKLWLD